MTRGAPPKNKATLVEQILTTVREGATLRASCNKHNIPERTVRGWRQADDKLDDIFYRARIDSTQAKLDVYEDGLVEAKKSGDRNKILAADKLLGHARWEAEKLLALYQPAQKGQQDTNNARHMTIGWLDAWDPCTNCGYNPKDHIFENQLANVPALDAPFKAIEDMTKFVR